MSFQDRETAGRALGDALAARSLGPVVVLGLPRGGVVVAAQVAAALEADLDVIVVAKLRAPGHPELALGAVAEGGTAVTNDDLAAQLGVSADRLDGLRRAAAASLEEVGTRLRETRPPVPLAGRTAVVVDDGVATGATARAACRAARARGADRVVLAAPVGPKGLANRFADDADEVVVLSSPSSFGAVSQHYDRFDQTDEAEVVALLAPDRPVDQ